MTKHHNQQGFTLYELLITLVIIALLTLTSLISIRTQRAKANDARRIADLEKIKIALYDYYSDNGCFPDEDDNPLPCGGSLEGAEESYLSPIPCDPTEGSYVYQTPKGKCPQKFRVLTDLQNLDNPAIAQAGCGTGPDQGCGEGCEYNYGVSSANLRLEKGCNNYWICPPNSKVPDDCERYEDPFISDCPLYSVNEEDVCPHCGGGKGVTDCNDASGKGAGGSEHNYY